MGPAHAAGRPSDRPPPSTSDFGEPTITRHNSVDAPPAEFCRAASGSGPRRRVPCRPRRTVHRFRSARTPPPRPPPSLPRRVPRALRGTARGSTTAPDRARRGHASQRPAPSPVASTPRQPVDGAEVLLCCIGGAVLRLADHDRGAVLGPRCGRRDRQDQRHCNDYQRDRLQRARSHPESSSAPPPSSVSSISCCSLRCRQSAQWSTTFVRISWAASRSPCPSGRWCRRPPRL